ERIERLRPIEPDQAGAFLGLDDDVFISHARGSCAQRVQNSRRCSHRACAATIEMPRKLRYIGATGVVSGKESQKSPQESEPGNKKSSRDCWFGAGSRCKSRGLLFSYS